MYLKGEDIVIKKMVILNKLKISGNMKLEKSEIVEQILIEKIGKKVVEIILENLVMAQDQETSMENNRLAHVIKKKSKKNLRKI